MKTTTTSRTKHSSRNKKNKTYRTRKLSRKSNKSNINDTNNNTINDTNNNTINDTINDTINNLLHYKSIFQNNHRIAKSIIFLKKSEFDIFYSCQFKYPILVKETITSETGHTAENETRIERRNQEDPFREDLEIPSEYRHSLNDYKEFMKYGCSMGHNAPAGQHKTNMQIFSETFLLSNITPQEMVLNSGLWALMENWCKELSRNNKLYNITVFTGSIPSNKNITSNTTNTNTTTNTTNFPKTITMNIPQKMFKIICFQHQDKPGITFLEIFMVNNSPYYINPKTIKYDLEPYLVSIKSWQWFQNFSGINIKNLLEFYSFNTNTIRQFRDLISMKIHLYSLLQLLIKKSNWFGYLIYSQSIEEIDKIWEECKLQEFESLEYHKEFYDLVRNRLLEDMKSKQEPLVLFTTQKLLFKNNHDLKHSKHSKHSKYSKH
jgi:DNA/RNA endonuclease G (NUC1)